MHGPRPRRHQALVPAGTQAGHYDASASAADRCAHARPQTRMKATRPAADECVLGFVADLRRLDDSVPHLTDAGLNNTPGSLLSPVVSAALARSADVDLGGRECELARLGPDPRRLVEEFHRVTVLKGYIDLGGSHPGWQCPGHVHLHVMAARLDLDIV